MMDWSKSDEDFAVALSNSANTSVLTGGVTTTIQAPITTVTVTTATDNNDAGIVSGNSAHTLAWLSSNQGADGLISLREAITAANNQAGADTIEFNIAGAGVHTISLDSALDYITDDVTLDATTQAGGSFTTPLIYLTKSGSYSGPDTGAIVVRANNTTVSGFIVGGWADEGIEIDGSTGAGDNNIIEYNWVGFDAAGAADGVGDDGILISDNADNNEVRNNVVASSGGNGIYIENGSDGNWLWGNTIGLATDGTTARGNTGHGIYLSGTNNDNTTIGTDGNGSNDVAERNVIASNTGAGVYVDSSTNVVIAGNYIGTDATGLLDRGNDDGIFVSSTVNTITIGGTAANTGNVISGNTDSGIEIDGADNIDIFGNIIGLGSDGTTIIENGGHGITAYGTVTNITIGGNTAARSQCDLRQCRQCDWCLRRKWVHNSRQLPRYRCDRSGSQG